MKKFSELRAQYPEFIYHSFTTDDSGFSFRFSIGEYEFSPRWTCERPEWRRMKDEPLIRYIVFSIGMVELVSYWKCACPPLVRVECGSLTHDQIKWWKKLYLNGLGEFFYRNGIETNFDDFMRIYCANDSVPVPEDPFTGERKGAVIPVGGGKDSIVTLELLKGMKEDNLCFVINPRKTTVGCAHAAGYNDDGIFGFSRTIDPELLRRNEEGWLNGHTPFSAIVAFSSYLAAVLTGRKYIALSNESSANEGNVADSNVNHQYSKSTDFEREFRLFCKKWLLPCPEYFSLLRPWTEWQIAARFVRYPQYFTVFRSCNAGSKNDAWCCKCAKCLYVYILLAAFLKDDELIHIFGTDMLDDPKNEQLFRELTDKSFDKPFECVGTRHEINLSLHRAFKLREGGKIPLLLERYMSASPAEPTALDDFYDNNNFVPAEFVPLLKG